MSQNIIGNFRTKKQKIKTAKGRTNSSANWIQRHINDPYVQLAKKQGYVSRAAFKILEIDNKFHFIKNSSVIVDLGAAPGGWLQVLAARKRKNATLIGIDLQTLSIAIPDLIKIQGNFLEPLTQEAIMEHADQGIDLIVSDMAVASSGDRELDHLRNIELIESVHSFAVKNLKKDGSIVIKFIRGGSEAALLQSLRKMFNAVRLFKPETSYKDSAEIYIVGLKKI